MNQSKTGHHHFDLSDSDFLDSVFVWADTLEKMKQETFYPVFDRVLEEFYLNGGSRAKG